MTFGLMVKNQLPINVQYRRIAKSIDYVSLRTDFFLKEEINFVVDFYFLHPFVVVVCCKENKFGNTSPLDVEVSGKSDGKWKVFFSLSLLVLLLLTFPLSFTVL
jgi:hypothetical protein